MDNNIVGQPAELHFTIKVTRAATGLEETFNMVGTQLTGEEENVNDSLNRCEECSN